MSKFEAQKSEARNKMMKAPNLKLEARTNSKSEHEINNLPNSVESTRSFRFEFETYLAVVCFGFRASDFEFVSRLFRVRNSKLVYEAS